MKLIRTEDAVGQVLCHDITQIIPGVVKDAVFRKGHIVTREDIPVLLSSTCGRRRRESCMKMRALRFLEISVSMKICLPQSQRKVR